MFVLVPSPLLGPAAWRPLLDVLTSRGLTAVIAPVSSVRHVEDPARVVDAILADIPRDEPIMLVLHSNAGLYAAAIAAHRTVAGIVFVDAGIPVDGGLQPLAPVDLVQHLRPLADPSGMLPGWTHWFDPADVDALFPDELARQRVESEQAVVSLAYLESSISVPADWGDQIPMAYLAFGDTYAAELARAGAQGWPTAQLNGAHLHQIMAPETVSDAVLALAARLAY